MQEESIKEEMVVATTVKHASGLATKLNLPLKELVVAPMVDQSELAFRMLCRKYGATLCYTPMLHSRIFAEMKEYREKKFTTCPEDRPLFVQFCGNNKDLLLEAAKHVEGHCDAVDLNLGCPQGIAKRGEYGAFLLEKFDLLASIVSHLSSNLSVPVTCKIRLLPSLEKTIELAKLLEASGCSLLTVHGRTKEQKQSESGRADWDAIRQVKEALKIPVFANGSIGTYAQAMECLEKTGTDGIMSSEAILENPALCGGMKDMPPPTQLALEYLELVTKYPDSCKVIRAHIFKLLHGTLSVHADERAYFSKSIDNKNLADYVAFLETGVKRLHRMHVIDQTCTLENCKTQQGELFGPWYDRHQRQNQCLYKECEDTGEVVSNGTTVLSREEIMAARIRRKANRKKFKAQAAMNKDQKRKYYEDLKEKKDMKRAKRSAEDAELANESIQTERV